MTTHTYIPTKPRSDTKTLYHQILQVVRDAGLLKKTPKYYIKLLASVAAIHIALIAGIILSVTLYGNGWLSMLWMMPAVGLMGILTAQYGFVAHEAAHKQVFNSVRLNKWFGIILANLFAGMSYGFWLNKHNRHHQKPNQLGADPDIELPVISFTKEQAENQPWYMKPLTKLQGKIFFLLLMFTAFTFIIDSVKSLIKPQRYVKHRWIEAVLFTIRQVAPIAFLLLLFPPLQAGILYLTFMCLFGLFIGGAFAPNHKGMPLLPKDAKLDFFSRQVLLSRNITPSWFKDLMMGGLNYQVEHHLFPSMPRTSLSRAHKLVKDFCAEHSVPFTEVGLFKSYQIIVRYLDDVGLAKGNMDPFMCPIMAQYRPRM